MAPNMVEATILLFCFAGGADALLEEVYVCEFGGGGFGLGRAGGGLGGGGFGFGGAWGLTPWS